MQINIIHDSNRVDRKVLLDSEIRTHGLDVRLWPAIKDPQMTFRGINLAHKQIVRWAGLQKMPMVCIGEDDLHITGEGAWTYFVDHIPADFDLYLSCKYCGQILPDKTIKDFCGLHLYIVHERFYETFLGVNELEHLDRGLANKGKFVVAQPCCAIQYDGWSDQKGRYAAYGHLLTGLEMCCDTI